MKNNSIVELHLRVVKAMAEYKKVIANLAGIDTDKPESVNAYFGAMEMNKTLGHLLQVELARLRRLWVITG